MNFIKNILIIIAGIFCIITSFLGYSYPKVCSEKNADLMANAALDGISKGLKERIFSAKNQMQILAKNTELSQMKQINYVYKNLIGYKFYLKSLFFSSEIDNLIISINEYINDCQDKLDSIKDFPEAFERLFYYILTFGKSFENEDEENEEDIILNSKFNKLKYHFNFLQLYNTLTAFVLENTFFGLEHISEFGGNIGLFQNFTVENPVRCASILSLALDNGSIRKIILRNAEYDTVLSVGQEKFEYICNDDINQVIKGKSFSIGGINYSKSGIPFWQITVPIRDINYNNTFYMTGFIDISDILELNEKKFKLAIYDSFGNSAGDSIKINEDIKNTLIKYSSPISILNNNGNKYNLLVGKGFKSGSESFSNDFLIFIDLELFMYLNDYYYTCILGLIVLFLTGVTLIIYGGFAIYKNNSKS